MHIGEALGFSCEPNFCENLWSQADYRDVHIDSYIGQRYIKSLRKF